MTNYVATLLKVLDGYGLCDRRPELVQYILLAQCGQLSQDMAKALLFQVQEIAEELEDFPCLLHRAPTADQLFSEGPPDFEFFSLVEGEDNLRYGLRLTDRVRHALIAGSTGSGKTTAIRNIIFKIDALNKTRTSNG